MGFDVCCEQHKAKQTCAPAPGLSPKFLAPCNLHAMVKPPVQLEEALPQQ
jgi:hypothetical protein